MFSPEIEGRRIGEARPEWEILLDIARRVRPDLRGELSYPSSRQLREEIAQVVPAMTASSGYTRPATSSRPVGSTFAKIGSSRRTTAKRISSRLPLPNHEIPEAVLRLDTTGQAVQQHGARREGRHYRCGARRGFDERRGCRGAAHFGRRCRHAAERQWGYTGRVKIVEIARQTCK